MARGGHADTVPAAPPLPKVSFQKIEDDVSTQPSGVHDGQARSFGYNDFSDFTRPDQYIRHIEPLEIDLERQVEYDMDEQDQEWLDAVNADRKKEQLDRVTYEIFEVVMDRLEKEWFNLTKHIPKPDLALPSEDSTCAICDDSEGENSNAIVFCDGCNLAVHQDCYGVPYIPEGQWLCRKCTVSPENPVSCILCPNEGGAFKQTTQGEWIHLLCAIWVPETRVSNDVFMEPIIGAEKIPKQRWKLKCSICGAREGACIQCARSSCFLAFHVTCGRKDKWLLPMKSAQGVEPGALTAYCEKHLPKEQADIREAALLAEEEEEEDQYQNAQLSKSARAYNKTYKPGPPLVPAIIIDRILQYISRTTIRKKQDFVASMCKYWSLKREARRGAPLLKRLHLEPWTASSSSKTQGEEEKVMKLEQLQHLRKDLEDLKGLTQLSRKRESRKLKQAELIHEFLSQALFLHAPKLRLAFERIQALDRNDYFKMPVNKKDVPDYFDVVKNPMCWSQIETKLDRSQYWDIQSFKDDIQLVLDNAVLYNKEGTAFHKTALRIRVSAQPILADLDQLSSSPNLRSTEQLEGTAPPWTLPLIGDLEPPLEILELLLSVDAIDDDSELILSADPITSLFNFEFEKKKLPPPNLEDLKEEQKRKGREERRERDRKKRQTTSAPPDLRVTRTRGAAAVTSQAEASTSVSAPRRAGRPYGSTNKNKGTTMSAPVSQVSNPIPNSIPAPGEIPLVEHVDEKGSFTLFEQGWILPAGQKRGVRLDRPAAPPSAPPPAPPPKKRMRLDRGTSHLSVFSTAASENQTLQLGSPRADEPRRASVSSTVNYADNSMDVDEPERSHNISVDSIPSRVHSLPLITPTPERVVIPPPTVIHTPDGKVIIEELDTPAIRKEKSAIRKEQRLRAREELIAAETAAAAVASTTQIAMEDGEPLSPISPSPEPPLPVEAGPLALITPGAEADPADADVDADADADAEADTDDGASSVLSEVEAEAPKLDGGVSGFADGARDESGDGEWAEPANAKQAGRVEDKRVGRAEGKKPERANGKRPQSAPSRPRAPKADRERHRDLGKIVLPVGQKRIEPGTLASYPWWPACVWADSDPLIPPKVLAEAQMERKKRKTKDFLYIIRFFDKTQSWQYLSVDKMRQLGEIKELDQDMLSKNSTRQSWGSRRTFYADCQVAYE
ncbi:bromodomain and PHD finger-containing protein 3 [Mycena albidolilacea]|uniref:Bromodomain and PHD finger-containing protein 3 n=1 Tax=Mycena albidolilacea TaxID=1033008 RepID=A0AAD7AEN6_9AGAR|nr:bromodomain and PHD finger-containing protein 3 [Mycena albidolilacea]